MRRTLLWSCPLLFLLLRLSASLALEHTIVFPRLLESRDANGQKTLIVNDDITLQLTPSSVFAEELQLVGQQVEDGSPVKYYFQGAEYERNLYYDNFHMASLTVNTHNGVQVPSVILQEGLIGSTLRIKSSECSRTFIGWSCCSYTLQSTTTGVSRIRRKRNQDHK
uniref:Putative tick metalloprotease n=1 Tax=Ixodes ricinus TaxID=34613 RepID=V5ICS3_IXORI